MAVSGASGTLEEGGAARHLLDVRGWTGAVILASLAGTGLVVALFGPVGSVSLLAGPLPATMIGLAVIGLVAGVVGRSRRWWRTWGIGIAVGAALADAVLAQWVSNSGLVDQHYPPSFLAWMWVGLVAVGIALTGWWSGAVALRALRVVTVPIVLFASFLLVNSHYGYWPTMGALLGRPAAGQVSGRVMVHALTDHRVATIGTFGPVTILGPRGFDGGGAWVWIPPAFNQVGHAHFPVLVLVPGVPGTPYDWEQAGEVVSLANAYARRHGGIAPVMVLVTGNGAADVDTECVNGPRGPAETYLTRSVPSFITTRLGITLDASRWGIVGFSEGGTCALGLATEAPGVYGRFVDLAGDRAPNLGPNAKSTLRRLFGGNVAAMLRHEPLWLLAHHRYPRSEGWFAGSSGSHADVRVARVMTAAARAAGMRVWNVSGAAGGHSWSYAARTFRLLYPALVASMATPDGHVDTNGRRPYVAIIKRTAPDRHNVS